MLECNAAAVERKGLRQKLVTSTTDQLAAAAGDDDSDDHTSYLSRSPQAAPV